MGLIKKGKEVVAVQKKGKVITSIYKKLKLIWQSIRSCFGSGVWVNDKPFLNEEGWRNY